MKTTDPDFEAARVACEAALDSLVEQHGVQVLPVMIGALIVWSIENGAVDLMHGTMTRSIDALVSGAAVFRKGLS